MGQKETEKEKQRNEMVKKKANLRIFRMYRSRRDLLY